MNAHLIQASYELTQPIGEQSSTCNELYGERADVRRVNKQDVITSDSDRCPDEQTGRLYIRYNKKKILRFFQISFHLVLMKLSFSKLDYFRLRYLIRKQEKRGTCYYYLYFKLLSSLNVPLIQAFDTIHRSIEQHKRTCDELYGERADVDMQKSRI